MAVDQGWKPLRDLPGKVAIITGAGSGIGRVIASMLANNGVRVVLGDIDPVGLAATCRMIETQGGSVESVVGDISVPGTARDLVERALLVYERIDIVVNSAALMRVGTVGQGSPDAADLDRALATNVRGPWLMAHAALTHLGRSASIINIASINGIVAAPGLAAYSISKAALISLTQVLALELAESGIRVNAICPGSVETPMLQAAFDGTDDPGLAREQNVARHPLGRLAAPEDIGRLALFLASDDSGFITGASHVVDGGALLARVPRPRGSISR